MDVGVAHQRRDKALSHRELVGSGWGGSTLAAPVSSFPPSNWSMYVRMHNELATKLGSQINTIDTIVCLQFSSAKQTRIDDFFNCSCTISI